MYDVMIYVTLGTQPCDFSRCMRMVETLIKDKCIEEEIVAQTGYTTYKPHNVKCVDFLSEKDYHECIAKARIVISHAGTGALFSSIKKGKIVIAVARLKKYGEMVNDHQLEIVKKLSDDGYIIDGTNSLSEAWEKIASFSPRPFDFENELPSCIQTQIEQWLTSKK